MPKPPTDYVLCFLGQTRAGGKRELVIHKKHINVKALKLDLTKPYYEEYNGNRYKFMPVRALRLKGWVPWRMWDAKHQFKSIWEILRRKRIGILFSLEPSAASMKTTTQEESHV